jgi:ketosteroid isomerase-like protein
MLLRFITSCLLIAGATVTGVASSPALAQDDPVTICNTAITAFEAAVASGDPAKVAARFTTDGTETTPFGIFQGPQAIAQFNAGSTKPGAKDSDTLKTAQRLGDAVLCTGSNTFTFAPGSPMKDVAGYWTKVLIKIKNQWLLTSLTFNITPPPMPPQPAPR